MTTTLIPPKATRKEWIALSMLVVPTLLVSMDMTVTYLALPVLSATLKPSSAGLLWITDIFGFMQAGLLIVMGSLGDRIGVKKLLLSGAFAFTVASAGAAFAPTAFWLIIARAVMGIGGATLLTSVISIIRNMFHDDAERTFAMGLYTTCFSSGTILGPLIGGFLLGHFWWGSIFLMPVPLIVVLLAAGPALLPEFKDPHAGKLDFFSAALLIAALLLVIFGIKQAAQDGLNWPDLLSVVVGGGLAYFFMRREKTMSHPLIDLQLFRSTRFKVALIALFVGVFSWAGIYWFVGQYMQAVLGFDTLKAGFWMIPGSAASIALCMMAPVLLRFISRAKAITCGLTILGLGVCLLAFLTVNSLTLLVVSTMLMSGGCGIVVTLGIDLVVSSVPQKKAGAAAGISETSTGFGGALGIAVLGSIWTALYRGKMVPGILAGLSVKQAAIARNTIGGAVAEAAKLRLHGLIAHARVAFVQSLHITASVCTLLVLATAILVAIKLEERT